MSSARITGGMGRISPALQGVVSGTSQGHSIPARDGVIPCINSEFIMNEGCPFGRNILFDYLN